MAYTPNNNPYIPGDPYSYDLKWLVAKIKELFTRTDALAEQIPTDAEIIAMILKYGNGSGGNMVSVKAFGAKGDGVTDDYDAIMAAYNAAILMDPHPWLYFPAGTYLINTGLVLPDPINVLCDGHIYSPGQFAAVTVGQAGSAYSQGLIQIWDIRGMGAANAGSIGLELINSQSNLIVLRTIALFETGLLMMGDGAGCQNNTVIPMQLGQCTDFIVLDNTAQGWTNENLFLGGRLFTPSSHSWTAAGITITSHPTGTDPYYYNNDNIFVKPNLERADIGVKIEYGRYNKILYARTESVGTVWQISNDGQNNEISIENGVNASYIPFNRADGYRVRDNIRRQDNIWRLDYIGAKAARTGANSGSIAGLKFINNSGVPSVKTDNGLTPNADGTVSLAAGRYVGQIVRFPSTDITFDVEILANVNQRGFVAFFDSADQVITDTPVFPAEATGSSFTANTLTGWRYSAARHYMVSPPAGAAYAFIGFESQASSRIQAIKISADNPFTLDDNNCCLAAQPTTDGVIIGQTVYNDSAAGLWIWTGSAWASIT